MRIIYKNKDNTVSVLIPSTEALNFATIEQIADKDVPTPYQYPTKWVANEGGEDEAVEFATYNTPYWIVEDSEIPTDRTNRDLWEFVTDVEPNGFGGESNEFDAELLKKYYESEGV